VSEERSPVRSMTGFAERRGTLVDGSGYALAVKSVNHRFLDLHLRLPAGLDAVEAQLRVMVKGALERGHVELTLQRDRSTRGQLVLNESLLAQMVEASRRAQRRHYLVEEPNINDLLRLPGVLAERSASDATTVEELSTLLLRETPLVLGQLQSAREQEGVALAHVLAGNIERMDTAAAAIIRLRLDLRPRVMERIRARMQDLVEKAVSEERLLQEAALICDRSDVEEEMVRLNAHCERFRGLLGAGGPVGKQLDFLLQEMQREANTTLSKTGGSLGAAGLELTELGLLLKSEIEAAREQVQNLE
jgi:uncharacterized protein (TIGR00255 family)